MIGAKAYLALLPKGFSPSINNPQAMFGVGDADSLMKRRTGPNAAEDVGSLMMFCFDSSAWSVFAHLTPTANLRSRNLD